MLGIRVYVRILVVACGVCACFDQENLQTHIRPRVLEIGSGSMTGTRARIVSLGIKARLGAGAGRGWIQVGSDEELESGAFCWSRSQYR